MAWGHIIDFCPGLTQVLGNLYFNVPMPVGTPQAYVATSSKDSYDLGRGFGPGTNTQEQSLAPLSALLPNRKQRVFDAKPDSSLLLFFPT